MGCSEISLGDTIGVGTPGKPLEWFYLFIYYFFRKKLRNIYCWNHGTKYRTCRYVDVLDILTKEKIVFP